MKSISACGRVAILAEVAGENCMAGAYIGTRAASRWRQMSEIVHRVSYIPIAVAEEIMNVYEHSLQRGVPVLRQLTCSGFRAVRGAGINGQRGMISDHLHASEEVPGAKK